MCEAAREGGVDRGAVPEVENRRPRNATDPLPGVNSAKVRKVANRGTVAESSGRCLRPRCGHLSLGCSGPGVGSLPFFRSSLGIDGGYRRKR